MFAKKSSHGTQSHCSMSRNKLCKSAEWFDSDCYNARQPYLSALNKFNCRKTVENRLDMCCKRAAYKRVVRNKKRSFEFKKCREIVNLRHSNPTDFWRLFSKDKQNISSNISLETFFNYFSSQQNALLSVNDTEAFDFSENFNFDNTRSTFEELDKPVTVAEISAVIRNLKRNKSVAGDNLLNEYFIESFDILGSHLVDIFNAILDSGHFPELWTKGVLVPIFKKNDPNDVKNYRGITLVSCFSKIFTGVINKRLDEWIKNNNVLSDAQFGFRAGRSTIDAIFILNAVVNKVLNDKGRLYCAFIDLKKAFDSINHCNLWYKLFRLGIDGKMLRIIKNMYSIVKTCIKGNNSYSDFFDCIVGLKQGEVISPVLFSLFLDDIETFLRDDTECGFSLDDIL